MNSKITNIFKSSIFRNTSKLLSANIIAQAIGLIIYPILTRIYSPEAFGTFNLFLSISNVFILLSTASYQYAIPIPKEDKEAAGIFHLGLVCLLIVTTISILFIPAFPLIAKLLNAQQLNGIIWLLPIYLFASGLWQLLNNWYIRHKQYTNISVYQVTQNIFSAGSKWGLGYITIAKGLIIGTVIAPLCALCISISGSWKKHIKPWLQIDFKNIIPTARKYYRFPSFQLPRSLLNMLNSSVVIWLISPFFGLDMVGAWVWHYCSLSHLSICSPTLSTKFCISI